MAYTEYMDRIRVGKIKQGTIVMINDRPCKIVSYSAGKTSKHGPSKATLVGRDVITQKKVTASSATSDQMWSPTLKKESMTLMDVSSDGFMSLLSEEGLERNDLRVPDDDFGQKIMEGTKDGFDIMVTLVLFQKEARVVAVQYD